MDVLLLSAGGLVGTYLIKHFKEIREDFRIIATDMSEMVPAKYLADAFFTVPATSDSGYVDAINEIISACNPKVIIPITSYDVLAFAADPLYCRYYNRMLIMNEEQNRILHQKRTSYDLLRSIGVLVPKVLGERELVFPCVLKPNVGTGSKNTYIINDKLDYDYWSKRVKDFILCEYLPGEEYTVDCLFDRNGKCLGSNARKRIKQVGGGAVISQNAPSESIMTVIEKLENLGWIVGPANFQYKKNMHGEPIVFDFNTRLASGGLALTVKSGFDIPMNMIEIISGNHVQNWRNTDENTSNLMMIRYYEEMFVDD
ncbi:MAG: ATP-grasp domain-containing protein [Christensenellales bacterium]|jgi:carbamoyl-phosphate synthase large subunit